jgi:glutamate-1-semialdehyde 2,1-aminomutase
MGTQIAAIIIEPIAGNMNCVPASATFLETLKTLCDQHQSLLIFDEVMTGFRVALGGAQSLYGIQPDITILGKIIGGGMPVGAFGGKAHIMKHLAPEGAVYQAGTLSGNPVAMRAGLVTLELISIASLFEQLTVATLSLVNGIHEQARANDIAFTTNAIGGMFGLFFSTANTVTTLAQATDCDQARFRSFFHGMLKHGVYLAPSPFEAGFVSAAHSKEDIDKTIEIAGKVMATLP